MKDGRKERILRNLVAIVVKEKKYPHLQATGERRAREVEVEEKEQEEHET